MNTLEEILLYHARQYPLMEPTDAVKLIYQNEFGGGHLIQDEARCLAYLRREYESVPQTDGPLTEDIGNGIVRVFLNRLDEHGCNPDRLGRDFIRSARCHRGSMESFFQKLEILRQLAAEGVFSFTARELDDYLAAYKESGYPAVSHSEQYRKAYAPAYRIVLKSVLYEK